MTSHVTGKFKLSVRFEWNIAALNVWCVPVCTGNVNCLVANGLKFSHPLHHLGKSANDLPVLAIDSFRHMYVWPHNPQIDIE